MTDYIKEIAEGFLDIYEGLNIKITGHVQKPNIGLRDTIPFILLEGKYYLAYKNIELASENSGDERIVLMFDKVKEFIIKSSKQANETTTI